MKTLNRLLSVLYMGVSAAFSVVAVCFIGPGVTAAVGALFFGWLAVWRWEARQ
jgi:hypothetical protein